MANPFSTATISGYNSSPPPDDGSNTAANEIKWATHINKIGDPVKNFAAAIQSNITTAFTKIAFNGVTALSTDYTVLTSDQGKLLSCTGTITLTLPAAATAGTPFMIAVKNGGTGTITIDGNGTETIDGSTTYSVLSGVSVILVCNGSAWTVYTGGQTIPTGTINLYIGTTEPAGWLFADGDTIGNASSGATHADDSLETLFNLVKGLLPNAGTEVFSDGDTVNLPDFSGRTPFGKDDMSGTAVNRIQVSTTITTTSASSSAIVGSAAGLAIGMTIVSTNVPADTTITAISGTTITMSANASAAGTATAARFSMFGDAETLGSSGGEQTHTQVTDEMAAHTHTVAGTFQSHNYSINDTPISNLQSGSTTATSSTGGGLPANVLPPGIVCNYIIKT